jgi:hypothetical protein
MRFKVVYTLLDGTKRSIFLDYDGEVLPPDVAWANGPKGTWITKVTPA